MSLDATRERLDGLERRRKSSATGPLVFFALAGLATVVAAMTSGGGAAWAVGGGSFVVLVLWVLGAVRQHLRHRVEDDLLTNLPALLGWRGPMNRKLLQCRGWTGGFRGFPSKIIAAHSATKSVTDIKWLGDLRAVVQEILPEVKVSIAPHKTKHLRIVISCRPLEAEVPSDTETDDVEADHVASVMTEIFVSGAEVQLEKEDGVAKRITVKHDRGNDMAMVSRRQRVERIVSARLRGDWRSAWDLVNNQVVFTLREPLPTVVLPDPQPQPVVRTHKDYEAMVIPYAVAENGVVLEWRPKVQPHMLISGPTGGGKTTIEHQLIERIAQAGCKLWLCDGKRIEFMGFRGWPNVELIAAKTEHKVKMIREFFDEMNRRYDLIESGKVRVADLEPMFMVVDEAATLVTQAQLWYAEVKPKGARSTKVPLMDWLGDIARLARTAKMHMIVGLQRPDVRFLDGEMRDNFACRASVGKLGADGAQMMWGNPHTGAGPAAVPGRGWSTTPDGRVVEAQFHYAPNPDASREEYDPLKVAAVKPTSTTHAPKHIEFLEPDEVDLDGEPVLRDFNDYMDARILDGIDPTWGGLADHEAMAEAAATEFRVEVDPDEVDETQDAAEELHPKLEAPAADEQEITEDPLEDDELEEMLPARYDTQIVTLPASHLQEGFLVLMEEELSLWGVVDSLSVEDTGVVIDYRLVGTGEPESLTLDDSTLLQVRCPIDTTDDEDD